jgi:hypothetical protein
MQQLHLTLLLFGNRRPTASMTCHFGLDSWGVVQLAVPIGTHVAWSFLADLIDANGQLVEGASI